jgi:WD40 repeat protein
MGAASGRGTPLTALWRRGIRMLLSACALAVVAPASQAPGPAAAQEGPPERPDTRQVMFVGNNWDGTADIVDASTFERLGRIDVIPDKEERLQEIQASPDKLAFFLLIRSFVGEGHDQYVDDMFTTHDGELVAVSRPSFADVVGISLQTRQIVWRFPMEGYRADHMAISPDGTRLLVSDSTANKVHELDIRTGQKTGEFPSGDSPHENTYSRDGTRIFHASIGRGTRRPTARSSAPRETRARASATSRSSMPTRSRS